MKDFGGRGRALAWLALIPAGAVAGLAVWAFVGLQTGPLVLGPQTVIMVAIGAGFGCLVGIGNAVVRWRSESRIARVRERHPGAVVFGALHLEATGAALGLMFGMPPLSGSHYTVAFSGDGMHVYAGSGLTPVVDVPWSAILEVHEELVREPLKSQQAVVVGVRMGEGGVGLAWGVSVGGRRARPAVVAGIRSEIEAMRASAHRLGTADTKESVPGAASTRSWPFRHELRRGLTSQTWSRLAVVPGILSVIVIAVLLVGIVTRVTDAVSGSAYLVAVLPIVLLPAISLGLLAISNAVAKREVALGYTLSRLGPIAVDQVDAKSGFVVRRAGYPQLSKAQNDAELARVRSIDAR